MYSCVLFADVGRLYAVVGTGNKGQAMTGGRQRTRRREFGWAVLPVTVNQVNMEGMNVANTPRICKWTWTSAKTIWLVCKELS